MTDAQIVQEVMPYVVGITGAIVFVSVKAAVQWAYRKLSA